MSASLLQLQKKVWQHWHADKELGALSTLANSQRSDKLLGLERGLDFVSGQLNQGEWWENRRVGILVDAAGVAAQRASQVLQ